MLGGNNIHKRIPMNWNQEYVVVVAFLVIVVVIVVVVADSCQN